jgi:hypothetical protein
VWHCLQCKAGGHDQLARSRLNDYGRNGVAAIAQASPLPCSLVASGPPILHPFAQVLLAPTRPRTAAADVYAFGIVLLEIMQVRHLQDMGMCCGT